MEKKYLDQLRKLLQEHLDLRKTRAFLFGSVLRKKKFYDVDVGLTGKVEAKKIKALRDKLEESNFPYKVDLVDFEKTEQSFRDHVLNEKVLWLN